MRNYDTTTFPGGIRNRITRVTMFGGGSIGTYMTNFTDQNTAIRSKSETITPLPPDERSRGLNKANDI